MAQLPRVFKVGFNRQQVKPVDHPSDLIQGVNVAGKEITGAERAVQIGTDLVADLSAKLLREKIVEAGRVTAASARPLVAELMERGGDVEALVRERGLEAVSDTGLLESAADAAIEAHAEVAAQVRAGEDKGLNFLMGQVMKRTQGKADPKAVREILTRKLRG